MPTDDERREVAARLRDIGEKICYTSLDVLRAIQDACGCNVGLDWEDMEELRDRLADLIEPEPERTCEWKRDENGIYYGECGIVWEFTYGGVEENGVVHCLRCGGKVVER